MLKDSLLKNKSVDGICWRRIRRCSHDVKMSKWLSFSMAKTLFLRRLGKVQKTDARGLLVVTAREQNCINGFDPAVQSPTSHPVQPLTIQ